FSSRPCDVADFAVGIEMWIAVGIVHKLEGNYRSRRNACGSGPDALSSRVGRIFAFQMEALEDIRTRVRSVCYSVQNRQAFDFPRSAHLNVEAVCGRILRVDSGGNDLQIVGDKTEHVVLAEVAVPILSAGLTGVEKPKREMVGIGRQVDAADHHRAFA